MNQTVQMLKLCCNTPPPPSGDTIESHANFLHSKFRRANQLVKEGNDAAVPYCVATGNIPKVKLYFLSKTGIGNVVGQRLYLNSERKLSYA